MQRGCRSTRAFSGETAQWVLGGPNDMGGTLQHNHLGANVA